MVNGFGDLEGSVPGSQLPVCQYSAQRARQISDAVSFALAVFPMVRNASAVVCTAAVCTAVLSTAPAIAKWKFNQRSHAAAQLAHTMHKQ